MVTLLSADYEKLCDIGRENGQIVMHELCRALVMNPAILRQNNNYLLKHLVATFVI